MCLTFIRDRKPEITSGVGFKVFQKRKDGTLSSDCRQTKAIRKRGIWLKATGTKKVTIWTVSTDGGYKAGFHIFNAKTGAKKWRGAKKWKGGGDHYAVYKVKYRKATCIGAQDGWKIIVAKEMRILEEVK